MRAALVGPTHPFKGGVAQHTTVLAQRLQTAGHAVTLVSWSRQYPRRLYPGTQTVQGPPEFATFETTVRSLAWNDPSSWLRTAWRLRHHDLVVVAHVTPLQAPAYAVLLMVLRLAGTPTVVVCHNVLPHERGWADKFLVGTLLRLADRILVHTPSEAEKAREVTSRPISIAEIAPFPPEAFGQGTPDPGEHRRLLFFGLVRPYKGVDVLLRALAAGPSGVHLRIAGEFWSGVQSVQDLVDELDLTERVELRSGYIPAQDVPALFRDVDALVLPYRSATGSQAVVTAYNFGLPVIVTRAGHLADHVRDNVDGVTAEPNDVISLTNALHRFYRPGVPEEMRASVRPFDADAAWTRYLEVLLIGNRPKPARRVRRAPARVADSFEGGQQLTYSELQPLMLHEESRRRKALKIIRVLEQVLGSGALEGSVAVDIGCSAGFVSDELAARGARTVGIDIDRPGLAAAQMRFGDRVRFLAASGEGLPFADGSVDVAVFNHIYEHVPDADVIMTEIHRVLAKDGVAYLGLGNKHQIIEPHYRLPFLSWLPRTWADRYMRATGRGDSYYETYATRGGLRLMLRGFRVLDFTVPVIHHPEVYGSEDQITTRFRLPVALGLMARPLIPTFVWVATKSGLEPRQREALEGLRVLDLRGRRR